MEFFPWFNHIHPIHINTWLTYAAYGLIHLLCAIQWIYSSLLMHMVWWLLRILIEHNVIYKCNDTFNPRQYNIWRSSNAGYKYHINKFKCIKLWVNCQDVYHTTAFPNSQPWTSRDMDWHFITNKCNGLHVKYNITIYIDVSTDLVSHFPSAS